MPQRYPGSTGLGGRLPPHGASCSRRWPWAAGAKAQMPPHRLPRRCHLRARGCQAGGATTPPGHPTPAPGHCSMAGCRDPQNGVLRALRGRGGVGRGPGGRKRGRLGCLPAFLPLSGRGATVPPQGHRAGQCGHPARPSIPRLGAAPPVGQYDVLCRTYGNKGRGWGWAEGARTAPSCPAEGTPGSHPASSPGPGCVSREHWAVTQRGSSNPVLMLL